MVKYPQLTEEHTRKYIYIFYTALEMDLRQNFP